MIEIVDSLGGSLADLSGVPGRDLVLPAQQGPSQGADLDRAGPVLQVVAETLDELDGQVGIVVVVVWNEPLLWRARRCGPRRGGRRRRAGPAGGCGRARRGVRRPWSTVGGTGREDRSCGLDGRPSRSGPAGGTHPAWCWPACTRGTGRRPAPRRAASDRTRPDTGPTGPGWPSAPGPATPGLWPRATRPGLCRCGPGPRRAAGRRPHRRSRWTSAGGGTGPAARTASRPTPTPSPVRSGPGRQPTRVP